MHALRTAILEHTTAAGVHHDWLIEDPRLPDPKACDARLWTARVAPPPTDWAKLKRFELTVIPPHRRAYLTHQGPVSNDRGRVRRLASGTCDETLWTAHRIMMAVKTESIQIELQLVRQSKDLWLAMPEPR